MAWRLGRYLAAEEHPEDHEEATITDLAMPMAHSIDLVALEDMFIQFDINKDGHIDFEEFRRMLVQLGIAPYKKGERRVSASSDNRQAIDPTDEDAKSVV